MSRIGVNGAQMEPARYYHAAALGSTVATSGADATRVNALAGRAATVVGTKFVGVNQDITLTPAALTDGDLTGKPQL